MSNRNPSKMTAHFFENSEIFPGLDFVMHRDTFPSVMVNDHHFFVWYSWEHTVCTRSQNIQKTQDS